VWPNTKKVGRNGEELKVNEKNPGPKPKRSRAPKSTAQKLCPSFQTDIWYKWRGEVIAKELPMRK